AFVGGQRSVGGERGGEPLGELGRRLLHVVGADLARQVPDRHGQTVGAERTDQAGAIAQGGAARRVQPRQSVQKLLLRVRHDPPQVVLLRRLAPVGRVDARQLHGGDGGGVGAFQGGGHLRGGVLRVGHP